MTKLEAVQEVLRSIGRGTVSTLDAGGASEASQAERVLDEVAAEQESEGWWFNQRDCVELTPDSQGHVAMPDGALVVEMRPYHDRLKEFTQLGGRLYDTRNNTDVFTGTVKAVVIFLYDFGCIPPPIQQYITRLACERYNAQYGGSPQTVQYRRQPLAIETATAKARAMRYDDRASGVNLVRGGRAEMMRGQRARYYR